MKTVSMSLDEAHALATECLTRHGADEENARAVADIVTAAERDLCHSHGLFRIPGYVASLKSGKANGRAVPAITELAPGVVRVDGGGGFAPLALEAGGAPLIERARQNGIAALALNNIYHFAALWPETEALAEEGLAAFAFTAAFPYVVAPGGRTPIFGTNPMAFAWPRPGGHPMVFDQASSTMARGEIMLAARDGHSVPLGAGIDREGRDTTDPKAILEGGAQLAFGGYKGAALAMMVELLAGALIGDKLSFEAEAVDNADGGPPVGGELIIALDPARFGDAAGFAAHADLLFGRMLADEGVRLPGDRRRKARETTARDGIRVPESLSRTLVALAAGK
ncbi:Ldh family oxidoreductase [Nisaea acidiphila]|uniref:Ldh family oxidoreductase n=1 Tax=Nisaea acidiphila TaxID=1862145 RepID=A0A9J7APC6_9PROT|nr:Ldh family oxidoreductase [Nisaea acidiphila]UUX48449.1 Ldh family oxidoreductase [Nisaea acidiphila]